MAAQKEHEGSLRWQKRSAYLLYLCQHSCCEHCTIYTFARSYPGQNMDKGYITSLCIISENYMWIHNYFKIKLLVKEIYKAIRILKKRRKRKKHTNKKQVSMCASPSCSHSLGGKCGLCRAWARVTKAAFTLTPNLVSFIMEAAMTTCQWLLKFVFQANSSPDIFYW